MDDFNNSQQLHHDGVAGAAAEGEDYYKIQQEQYQRQREAYVRQKLEQSSSSEEDEEEDCCDNEEVEEVEQQQLGGAGAVYDVAANTAAAATASELPRRGGGDCDCDATSWPKRNRRAGAVSARSFDDLDRPTAAATNDPSDQKATKKEKKNDNEEDDGEDQQHNNSWEYMYGQLATYRLQHGTIAVPPSYPPCPGLCEWIELQRIRGGSGSSSNGSGRLPVARREQLELLGVSWPLHSAGGKDTAAAAAGRLSASNGNNAPMELPKSLWEAQFEQLREFQRRYGHCNVSSSTNGTPQLARWVENQQYRHRNNMLQEQERRKLDSIGFDYVRKSKKQVLNAFLQRLSAYAHRHGHCNVGATRLVGDSSKGNRSSNSTVNTTDNDVHDDDDDGSSNSKNADADLYHWCVLQRQRKRDKKLTSRRVAQLTAIGFDWNPPIEASSSATTTMTAGSTPGATTATASVGALYKAPPRRGAMKRNVRESNTAAPSAATKTIHSDNNNTCDDGESILDGPTKKKLPTATGKATQGAIEEMITEAEISDATTTGDGQEAGGAAIANSGAQKKAANVVNKDVAATPTKRRIIVGSKKASNKTATNELTDKQQPGPETIGRTRMRKRLPKKSSPPAEPVVIPPPPVVIPPSLLKRPYQVPTMKPRHKIPWDEMFERLKEYSVSHNNSCNVSRNEDRALATWIDTQRAANKEMKIHLDRKAKLESIGLIWDTMKERDKVWNEMYDRLKVYRSLYGDCLVPKHFDQDPDLALWVERNRATCTREDRIKRLDAIGFTWTKERTTTAILQEQKWNEMFETLKGTVYFCL
jgi:Helicase associated domain